MSTSREQILLGLQELAASGAVAKSACSAALLRCLRPLLDTQVVIEERSGAGRRLVVRHPDALEAFIKAEFPQAEVVESAGTRERAVATFRDSKALKNDTAEIVIARGWTGAGLCKGGEQVDAVGATRTHGVFSFVLQPEYTLRGASALVENPAVFLNFERLGLPERLVLWSRGGHISGAMLSWLAAQKGEFQLLHLPDYDPVGLSEFLRLRKMLGDRVRLHVPADLPEKFARFGNRRILDKENNRTILAALVSSGDEEIAKVVKLILNSNACLEQEALLI